MDMKWIQPTISRRCIHRFIFCVVLLISELSFLLFTYNTRGITLLNLLISSPNDSFCHFYKMIASVRILYTQKMTYPPLVYAIFSIIEYFIPHDIININGLVAKLSQSGISINCLWTLTQIFAFSWLLKKIYTSTKRSTFQTNGSDALLILLLFSFPFVFCLDRSSARFLTLIFLTIYIHWFYSEDKINKLIALVPSAVCASIKIYPAIIGLHFMRDRKRKQTLFPIALEIITFSSSFLLLKRENRSIFLLLSSIMNTAEQYEKIGYWYSHDLNNVCTFNCRTIGSNISSFNRTITRAVFAIVVIIMLIKHDIKYKQLLFIISLCIILMSGFIDLYTLVFMNVSLSNYLIMKSSEHQTMHVINSIQFLDSFPSLIGSLKINILNTPTGTGWLLTW